MAEKGGYRHFMLKEIYEQPRAVTDTLRGRDRSPRAAPSSSPTSDLDPATMTRPSSASSSSRAAPSYHAAHAGPLHDRAARRHPGRGGPRLGVPLPRRARRAPRRFVVAISQSGETADTLGAVKAAAAQGLPRSLAITNVVGSALAREATGVLYTHAGPEIGVASTKAFTTDPRRLLPPRRSGSAPPRAPSRAEDGKKRIHELRRAARASSRRRSRLDAADRRARPRARARTRTSSSSARGLHYPDRARGRAQAEGDRPTSTPRATGRRDEARAHRAHRRRACRWSRWPRATATYERMLSNIEEVRARDGRVIAFGHEGDRELAAKSQHVIERAGRRPTCSRRCSRRSRSSSSRTTSPSASAATWTSRATSRSGHGRVRLGGGLRPPSDASPRTADCAGEAGARASAARPRLDHGRAGAGATAPLPQEPDRAGTAGARTVDSNGLRTVARPRRG